MNTIKILLDTDIGSDIDDALALSYLLAEPCCELMGITTVTGEPQKRAMMARHLCLNAGKNIPVYPGASTPLYGKQHQQFAPQATALQEHGGQTVFPEDQAVRFMQKTIREHPGEIILLAIAPLTNIALLFSIDHEIPSLLKGLVMMCGVFHYKLPELKNHRFEWNAIGDPFATSIVYNTPVAMHRSIGLDVTYPVTMPLPEAKKRFGSKQRLKPLLAFSEHHICYPHITFHDPLAAMSIFHDDILEYENGSVSLKQCEHGYEGMTRWNRGNGPDYMHQVASKVDADAFFERYFSIV